MWLIAEKLVLGSCEAGKVYVWYTAKAMFLQTADLSKDDPWDPMISGDGSKVPWMRNPSKPCLAKQGAMQVKLCPRLHRFGDSS